MSMLTATKFTEAAPLASFRIFFGLLMCISILRFWLNGWIEKLYLEPTFHFKYYGFDWVQVPSPLLCYLLFFVSFLSSFFVLLGYKYTISIITFFLSFTYIELMDKTTYLNHYYFISVLSFMLIFLPAHRYFSIDALKDSFQKIPAYSIVVIKILLAIVYIYAGMAKLNSDWLIEALPLSIWLPSKYNIPFLGDFLHQKWVHFLFSWAGAFFDLFIVFFLLYKPTRKIAFISVIVFHLLTSVLFPIGMFPYVMIASVLIFFSAEFHHQILQKISNLFQISKVEFDTGKSYVPKTANLFILIFVLSIQLLMPLRLFAYPDNVFWTEQGYRFSWRVMLMEKAGYAQFKIHDQETGKYFMVDNSDFLTAFQEKQMTTQPDFILEYAHFLGEHFTNQGHQNVEVYVESFVSLNGRHSRPFIDPAVNLLKINDSFAHRNWVMPYNE